MLYEMIIMSSTSQLYCQTKMNLKKVICCKQITFFCHFRVIKLFEGLPKFMRVSREGLALLECQFLRV